MCYKASLCSAWPWGRLRSRHVLHWFIQWNALDCVLFPCHTEALPRTQIDLELQLLNTSLRRKSITDLGSDSCEHHVIMSRLQLKHFKMNFNGWYGRICFGIVFFYQSCSPLNARWPGGTDVIVPEPDLVFIWLTAQCASRATWGVIFRDTVIVQLGFKRQHYTVHLRNKSLR